MRLLVVLTAALTLSAAQPALTPDTLWDIRTPTNPRISPNGQQVVYQLEWADKLTDAFHVNLWIASTNGGDNRPLTTGKQRDTNPVWSPDGTRLAYLSNRSGRPQIIVRYMDSGLESTITNLDTPITNLAWSPDSKHLAFFSTTRLKPKWSVTTTPPPANAKWTEGPSIVTRLRWRSDGIGGSGLLAETVSHLFVIPADGGAPRQLTSGDFPHTGPAAWSPDGKTIVVSSTRKPDYDRSLYPDDLYAVDVATGNTRLLFERNGPENNPAFSPDGKYIAFTGFADTGKSNNTNHLWVITADGKDLRRLGTNIDRNHVSPVWKPDSSGLFTVLESAGLSHLHFASLSGSIEQLTSGQVRYATGYGLADSVTISNSGTIAISVSGPDKPREISVLTPGGSPLVLTNSNAGLLANRAIGRTEHLTWRGPGNRSIEGWVILPPDFDSSKKYPFILDIHGGPHLMYGVEFQHQMQMFASRGYVVLYANPRGSTGYGEEFGNSIHTKYPGEDYDDLMAGVDAVLAKGYIDPKKLYVTGGSGGGLLTAWIVTKTERFAAAVSQYPVTNWFTQTGSADIGLLMTRWMGAMPYDNPQQYIAHSPSFFANKVKTPTMILTGEEDWRTPIAQSEEFYFLLKQRGVDTVLVRFPRENHGIRGAFPSHRIHKVEHILAWFDRH
jgi:acylaminoacyl-peptidase